jgi:RND family efflux transporter MFP subunit
MMKDMKFAITFVAALILLGCGASKPKAAYSPETVRGLEVLEVQRRSVPDYVEAVGTVRALQTSQLSAQIAGTVVSIHAQEGQKVHKGDLLIVLDDAQQRAGLERAAAASNAAQQDLAASDADYALAASTLSRYRSLFEKKSASPHEMEEVEARDKLALARRNQAKAGISQARAMEAQARAALGYTRIHAPFDGIVTAKQADIGALASPGTPLLTVEDTHRFRLEAAVDEGGVRFARLGEAVPVRVDALGSELQAKVVQIVPAADPASRSFVVKLELAADPQLRSGLFGRVRFARGQREAVMIPRAAVLEHGQVQSVYVVGKEGEIELRYVTLGRPAGAEVEILSGVSGGERLIASHGGRELAGKKVAN